MLRITVCMILLGFVCLTAQAQTASLTMRFVYDGDAPVPPGILGPNGRRIDDESLLVDPQTKGIQNVVVSKKF